MATEFGVGFNFLENTNSKIRQLATSGWLHSLWEFVSIYKISVKRIHNNARTLRNNNDLYIMEDVCRNSIRGNKDLLSINACIPYLKVELLSDILTADGCYIKRKIWQGI
jgi:hypothetical protein